MGCPETHRTEERHGGKGDRIGPGQQRKTAVEARKAVGSRVTLGTSRKLLLPAQAPVSASCLHCCSCIRSSTAQRSSISAAGSIPQQPLTPLARVLLLLPVAVNGGPGGHSCLPSASPLRPLTLMSSNAHCRRSSGIMTTNGTTFAGSEEPLKWGQAEELECGWPAACKQRRRNEGEIGIHRKHAKRRQACMQRDVRRLPRSAAGRRHHQTWCPAGIKSTHPAGRARLLVACVGLKSGKARTSLQHRLPAETGREPGESRESNKTGVEQGDMQRKQLTGHASKRVYDWQSGMAHWGETQRYGSMGWPNGSAER